MADDEQVADQENGAKQVIKPKKIYLKDLSFESPNAPTIFTADWDPTLAVDINYEINRLPDDTYHVVLTITARAVMEDTTAFLVEVHQGGVFFITDVSEDRLQQILNIHCLSTLYPYACSNVDSLLVKGGFPPIYLGPVNFNMRYKQMIEDAEANNDDEEPE